MKDTIVFFIFLSINRSLISFVDHFVFKYITPIFVSCRPYDVPTLVEHTPSNFTPTEVREVELNRVMSGGSRGDVYVVARASSDGPPPCFFKISCGDVAMSLAFNRVGLEHPMIFGSETRHDGELGLNVT